MYIPLGYKASQALTAPLIVPPIIWTPTMVQSRLEEAARTLRRLPFVERNKLSNPGIIWPEVVHESVESYGYSQEKTKLGPPTGKDIDRMDWALGRLWALDEKERILVWFRAEAPTRGFKKLCERFHCDRTTAWRWHRAALLKLAYEWMKYDNAGLE